MPYKILPRYGIGTKPDAFYPIAHETKEDAQNIGTDIQQAVPAVVRTNHGPKRTITGVVGRQSTCPHPL